MPTSSRGSTPARSHASSASPPASIGRAVTRPLAWRTSTRARRSSAIRLKNAVASRPSPGASALKSPAISRGMPFESPMSPSTASSSRRRRASPLLRSPKRAARCTECRCSSGMSAPPVTSTVSRWLRSILPRWVWLCQRRTVKRDSTAMLMPEPSLAEPTTRRMPRSRASRSANSGLLTSWSAITSACSRRSTAVMCSSRRAPPSRMLYVTTRRDRVRTRALLMRDRTYNATRWRTPAALGAWERSPSCCTCAVEPLRFGSPSPC